MNALISNARREALHVLVNGRAYRPSYVRLCWQFLRQWGVT